MDNVPVQVVQEWFQVPVLKFKTDNPVLRIRVSLNDETPVDLSEVLIGTSGTTNLRDIKAIRIYYDQRNDASAYRLNTDDELVTLFGGISRAVKKNKVPGKLLLKRGKDRKRGGE